MKGKLTPRESFILYGVWVVAAFALFMLGVYWGKGQAAGLSQEITTQQPMGVVRPAGPRTTPDTQFELAIKETRPPVEEQQAVAVPPASPPPSGSPAAPAEVKPPVATSAVPKEVFSIQVGALKTEAEARKVVVRLLARGYTGILDKPTSPKDFYRVRVGNYTSREDAARAEALLKEAGFLTFVKKLSEPGP